MWRRSLLSEDAACSNLAGLLVVELSGVTARILYAPLYVIVAEAKAATLRQQCNNTE